MAAWRALRPLRLARSEIRGNTPHLEDTQRTRLRPPLRPTAFLLNVHCFWAQSHFWQESTLRKYCPAALSRKDFVEKLLT
jgi:hypothetical protein